MTERIKPTLPMPLPPESAEKLGGSPPLTPASKPEKSFDEVLDARETRASAPSAATLGAQELSTELAQGLEAGKVSLDQAIDRVLAKVLADPSCAALGAEQRAELEGFLRNAIESDPAIESLLGDVRRRVPR